ncbi:MAG: hypothetical protein ACRDRO_04915 [Pseudonocardiaceae bacterium]
MTSLIALPATMILESSGRDWLAKPADAPDTGITGPERSALQAHPVTFHVLTYEEWRDNGLTHCCHRHVQNRPAGDECGSNWALRDNGQTRCGGTQAVTR